MELSRELSKAALLMLGGAVGTYLRYIISRWIGGLQWGQSFPLGTLVINVSGSFILAAAAVIILERLPPEHQNWYLLIGTGFCGGYTTFSTFEWETYQLVQKRSWELAAGNILGSVVGGYLGVVLGVTLMRYLFPQS
jgi:CrcB protein